MSTRACFNRWYGVRQLARDISIRMCNGLVKASRASCDVAYPEYALGTPLTDWNALQRTCLSNTIFTWGISNGRFSWHLTSWWILALSVEACAYSLCKSPCDLPLYRPWQQTSSSRGTFGVLCSVLGYTTHPAVQPALVKSIVTISGLTQKHVPRSTFISVAGNQ